MRPPRLLISQEFDTNIKDNKIFRLIDIYLFYSVGYSRGEIARMLSLSYKEVCEAVKKVKNHLKNESIESLLLRPNHYAKIKERKSTYV